jgi:hypothetical protein
MAVHRAAELAGSGSLASTSERSTTPGGGADPGSQARTKLRGQLAPSADRLPGSGTGAAATDRSKPNTTLALPGNKKVTPQPVVYRPLGHRPPGHCVTPPAPATPTPTDGVYEVDVEIKPGTYKTRAPRAARAGPPNGPAHRGRRGPGLDGQVEVVRFMDESADFAGCLGDVQDQGSHRSRRRRARSRGDHPVRDSLGAVRPAARRPMPVPVAKFSTADTIHNQGARGREGVLGATGRGLVPQGPRKQGSARRPRVRQPVPIPGATRNRPCSVPSVNSR